VEMVSILYWSVLYLAEYKYLLAYLLSTYLLPYSTEKSP